MGAATPRVTAMQTEDNLTILRPGGEQRARGGIVSLVESSATGGRWGAVVVTSDRSTNGATHIHRGEPEAFFILEGDLELYGAESVTPIGPGTFVLVPPDTEHGLRVLSDQARWLAIWPSALDGLLDDLEAARAEGRDDPATLSEIRRRHGVEPGRTLPGPEARPHR
jgi:quercetin dioxygenase-like cupin family protein